MKFFSMLFGKKKRELGAEDKRQMQDPPLEEGHESQHPASEDTYWFFLSYFFNAQDIEKDKFIASWSEALGRPYKSVVKEFLDKGLIMQAGLKEKLGGMLRIYDLQQILGEQGLSEAGKKDTLLRRYIEAMPQEAESRASKKAGDFLVCTPEGRKAVKQHGNRGADAQDSAQYELKNLLAQGQIDRAAEVVNVYMKSVDRPPQDNNWTKNDVKMVMNIKRVPRLTPAKVEEARTHIAMELLWYGHIKSSDYSPIPSFHQFAKFASIVIGKKRSQENLKGYSKNEFITRVEIMCNDDSCPKCKAVCGEYLLREAPLLPIKGCTHEDGCRCCYTPVVD